MSQRILITGSSGLVVDVIRFDILASAEGYGDITAAGHVRRAIKSCDGVIHLGAVSRVIAGERDPEKCWSVNVGGLQNLLDALVKRSGTASLRPWLIFASSREVYGRPDHLPADEDTPLCPVNIYGRSKVAGEQMVEAAARTGLRAAIVRLSNVYGSAGDHVDRVIPAFVRAAIAGAPLQVEGADQTFDFTHIDDVSRGIVKLAAMLADGASPPAPIHFVTGTPVTLGQLAAITVSLAQSSSPIRHAPPRDFDVAQFYGSPGRALSVLDWVPEIALEQGLARLIHDIRGMQNTIIGGDISHGKATAPLEVMVK